MSILIPLTILTCIIVGWSIGANDAANSFGTAVGSRVITLKRAIILIAIFGFLGAFLQGSHVAKTVGKNIIPLNELDKEIATYVALVASIAACGWVVIATYWKMPISTSHSIVGAVAGAGLAIHAPVNWKILTDIFVCWLLTPVGAAVLGYIFYRLFKNILYRLIPRKYLNGVLAGLIIASSCYVAFSWGANDVANATGVVMGAGIFSPNISIAIGGIAIVLGIVTWGYRVIETVGSEITNLLPMMAFSAQLASAINIHVYSILGIPVSTSHSIVGAIFGVGLVRGVAVVNTRIMKDIVICWLTTPFISGIISFILLKGILFFIN